VLPHCFTASPIAFSRDGEDGALNRPVETVMRDDSEVLFAKLSEQRLDFTFPAEVQ